MLTITKDHEYYLDNERIPGVNEILMDFGLINNKYIPEGYAERGRAIHRAFSLLLKKELDISSVPDEYLPYLENLLQWVQKYDVKVLSTEEMHFHKFYRYAGTIDLTCEIDGQFWIIDFKTGAKMKHYELQLSAYRDLLMDFEPKIGCLYLKAKTDHEEVEYSDVWNSCLKVWKWKNK